MSRESDECLDASPLMKQHCRESQKSVSTLVRCCLSNYFTGASSTHFSNAVAASLTTRMSALQSRLVRGVMQAPGRLACGCP